MDLRLGTVAGGDDNVDVPLVRTPSVRSERTSSLLRKKLPQREGNTSSRKQPKRGLEHGLRHRVLLVTIVEVHKVRLESKYIYYGSIKVKFYLPLDNIRLKNNRCDLILPNRGQ